MTDEERKKLNDKLLEFAGFRLALGCKDGCHVVAPAPSYKVIPTPDFTDPELGVGHCIKWLGPKLPRWEVGQKYYLVGETHWAKVWAKSGIIREGYDKENPALAFSRAVEKVIDAKD